MIHANLRKGLRREDAQLALRLVARGSGTELERAEAILSDNGLDALLDDPRLLQALLVARQGAHSSFALFAYVIVRHALRDAGEDDRLIADYVASILLHFGLRQRSMKLTEHDDSTYDSLAAISGELDGRDARRAFMASAHMGNYALWLSGMFPDHIEHRRWRRGGPDLGYFDQMGQKGFRMAADHRLAGQHGMTQIFASASEKFPTLRRALNNVSDRLLFPNVHSPERLMRQVQQGMRD